MGDKRNRTYGNRRSESDLGLILVSPKPRGYLHPRLLYTDYPYTDYPYTDYPYTDYPYTD
jgi:hypothetical protein